jgi:hypothetical protein
LAITISLQLTFGIQPQNDKHFVVCKKEQQDEVPVLRNYVVLELR